MTETDYIAAIAPALAGDQSGLPVFLEMARERTSQKFYGPKYAQAVALMACHLWFLMGSTGSQGGAGGGSGEAGSVGNISSKREGDLQVSYSSPVASMSKNMSDASLSQTRYGLELLALRKGCHPFLSVPGEVPCGC